MCRDFDCADWLGVPLAILLVPKVTPCLGPKAESIIALPGPSRAYVKI